MRLTLFVLLAVLGLGFFQGLAAADDAPGEAVALSAKERAWLAAHPVITFGPDPNWPPYETFDEAGRFTGIAAEHLALVAKRLGVTFKFVQAKSWAAVVEAVKAREIDCYSSAVATPDRRKYMLFTRPHITQPGVIFVRTDSTGGRTLKDLHGKAVTVVAGYWWEEALARDHPEITLLAAPNIEQGLGMLSRGDVDAMVNDPATSFYALHELGIRNVRLAARTPGKTDLAIGVRNDWPLLRDILDKALATITKEEFKAIEKRWVHMHIPEPESDFPWVPILGVLALVLGLVGGVVGWNRTLKARVQGQTDLLRGELRRREDVHRAVARTTVEVTGAATEISGSARAQAVTATEFQASALHASKAVDSISSTLEALLEAVEGIHRVAGHTTKRAEAGREQLQQLDEVMRVMAAATDRMGERVLRIQKSAAKIRLATVMMVKVVDQTNLLSVNSAIEAEKAGEHGRGFRVVSSEIQRLADQSAEATLQIEAIVRDMQDGVEEGVREAAASHEQVVDGVAKADHIGQELGSIMKDVGKLTSRFERIRGMVAEQTSGTETIQASIRQVHDGAEAISTSSAELSEVSERLQQTINGLRTDVSTLRRATPDGDGPIGAEPTA